LLTALGFDALATTSHGLANSLGRADGGVTRGEVIANCREIVAATDLPVNADLENCFADPPEAAVEAIRLAAEAGAVGGSIEDFTGDLAHPIYDFDLAVARVLLRPRSRTVCPCRSCSSRGQKTYYISRNDIADTIRRLLA
jgi:2-methylisocitrate lyase-like PEP mutase family enzyme